jgi:ABC-type transport system involved in multi-copper enzyme maturation permease subunit
VIRNILEIVIYELQAAVATRRALMVIGLYLACGIIGSVAFEYSVNVGEGKLIELAVQNGADPVEAALQISLNENEAFSKFIAFAVGEPFEALNPMLTQSPILPIFLGASLLFLPLLILLTSFDHIVTDMQNRSMCYQTLRVSRREILIGKTLAQLSLYSIITLISAGCVLLSGIIMLNSIDIGLTVPGLLVAWALLLPVGFCYLSITTFASSVAKQPFSALMITVFILLALKLQGVLGGWFDLPFLGYLRPSYYETGLWLASPSSILGSMAAYIAFGAFFLFLADRILAGRDL